MSRTLPAGTLRTVDDHRQTPAPEDDGPLSLRLAVLLLWIESALVAVLAAADAFKLATGHPQRPGLAAVLAGMVAAAALLLALLGRWLVRRRRWARGPAIVLQLMALPVAWFMVTGEGGVATRAGGVLIALLALTGAGLLLAPASRLELMRKA
jgi:lysylphosphatidylglycerol synthetase-like protein (DUF2156 family)